MHKSDGKCFVLYCSVVGCRREEQRIFTLLIPITLKSLAYVICKIQVHKHLEFRAVGRGYVQLLQQLHATFYSIIHILYLLKNMRTFNATASSSIYISRICIIFIIYTATGSSARVEMVGSGGFLSLFTRYKTKIKCGEARN